MTIAQYRKLISGALGMAGMLLAQYGVDDQVVELVLQIASAGAGLFALWRFPNE